MRDALDFVCFSWGELSLGQCNHMGIETSFHHAVACWCDNQAQRDEKHEVGGHTCINVCVCKTQKRKEDLLFYVSR